MTCPVLLDGELAVAAEMLADGYAAIWVVDSTMTAVYDILEELTEENLTELLQN